MGRWLIKSDPGSYGASDLERDRRTVWDGVTNAAAVKNIRAMAVGDDVLVYHTGEERAVVATARVVSPPRDARGAGRASAVVDVEFGSWLASPVPLAAVKADPQLADFALVRIGRLSVMPVSDAQWRKIIALSKRPHAD